MKTSHQDMIGASAGTLCVLQCLALPLLPWALAAHVQQFEHLLLALGVVLALVACARCCFRKQLGPAVVLGVGVAAAIVIMSLHLPHVFYSAVAVMWVAGHLWAYSISKSSSSCCPHRASSPHS